jgi:hypothetical protein
LDLDGFPDFFSTKSSVFVSGDRTSLAMEVSFLFSGEIAAVLEAAEFEGQSVTWISWR